MPTSRGFVRSAELAWGWGSFQASLPRIHELAQRHWRDVGGNTAQYRPDYSRYVRMEEAGLLHALLGRDHSGVIGGYMVVMLSPHLHTQRVAAQDMGIYLDPRHRGLRNLKTMFDTAEKMLYAKGASTFEVAQPAAGPGDRLGIFLRRRGYRATRTLYELRIER